MKQYFMQLVQESGTPIQRSRDQRRYLKKRVIRALLIVFILLLQVKQAGASVSCRGRFVNPISDICWRCLMPISIGGMSVGKGVAPAKRDIANPVSPICGCTKGNSVVPIPGISIGFWEPVRLVDVTRTPYCMVNLGGISLGSDPKRIGGPSKGYARRGRESSFYHLHYYVYPLIYWLELLTDFACLEQSSFDVAYMSEFDISWNDPKLGSLLNPEAILFGNPIAQIACGLDCASATLSTGIDSMFWCSGCYGNMYPFSGSNSDHGGGVQTSSLLTTRILAKLHRIGLARETSTTDASIDGKICNKQVSLKLKKSQYKLQLVNPRSSSRGIGCWPLGLSDMVYSAFNEYPYDGEDWGYLIWRKKNCCFF